MALVEGVKYGLSSHNASSGNKSVIFVKLTDSALRAIDDYLKLQHKTGQRATLQFQGNEGNIHIPSGNNDNGHNFDFSLSNNADIEGPQGSFECIQQCGQRSLESAGPLSYKMRVKANDDVFVQTQHRFNALENERKNECTKEIKSNNPTIGTKLKKKIGMPQLPPRREKSPSYVSHPPPPKPPAPNNTSNGSSNHKLPNGYNSSSSVNKSVTSNNNVNNRKSVNPPSNGSVTLANGTGSSNSNNSNKNGVNATATGNQELQKRPLKERLMHMLAVKPYKKPELYQRLLSDGLKERDRKIYMPVLQQVSVFKDNEYSLVRGLWNDIQEDWPFYTEQEKQLMKRRKPQNLTPPGSDSSVGSGASSLSPRSNSSIGSGHSPSYSQIPCFPKPVVTASGTSEHNYKNSPDGNHEISKPLKRPLPNGILPDNAEDYGDIPSKKTRVAHKKLPMGSGSNGIGANINGSSTRTDIISRAEKDGFNGSSPQFSLHNNRITERLSPIGTASSSLSLPNGSNGTSVLQTGNHKSPRNGGLENMDISPVHPSGTTNGYHSAPNDVIMEESPSICSSWQSRNGTDAHAFSDIEKTCRGDSDETDSVDSGNGSSTSGGSLGGSQKQNFAYNHSSGGGNNGVHPSNNHGGNNVPSDNKVADKLDSISSSVHNSANSTNVTNGCNRVSSTTNFHSTPQSSPDSQVDALHQRTVNSAATIKHNQRSNLDGNSNVEITITREKGDSHRDRDRRRNERDRGKEKDRDARNKDKERTKRSDKKHPRLSNRDDQEIEMSDGSSVRFSSDYPSYLSKYTTITCPEQRIKYKDDFNSDYEEYRGLHSVIDTVSKRFAHLEERLRQEERGTDGYEKIKEQIVKEYYANKRSEEYQRARQKFQYLHEKLSHIKRLVADYDAQHHHEQDGSMEISNSFARN